MITAYVDRIDGDAARLLIGNESVAIAIPLNQLPPGTREGTVLRLVFSIHQGATKAKQAAYSTE